MQKYFSALISAEREREREPPQLIQHCSIPLTLSLFSKVPTGHKHFCRQRRGHFHPPKRDPISLLGAHSSVASSVSPESEMPCGPWRGSLNVESPGPLKFTHTATLLGTASSSAKKCPTARLPEASVSIHLVREELWALGTICSMF